MTRLRILPTGMEQLRSRTTGRRKHQVPRQGTAFRLVCPSLLFLLAGCAGGPLDPHGPISAALKSILLNSVFVMLLIVVPTLALGMFCAWWYRASNTRARYQPDFTHSGRVELVIWSGPILIIMLLGGVIWIGSFALDPAKPLASDKKTLEVQVVSLDWKWLFIYPEQRIASVNQLVIPEDRPVHFSMTSASVMNTLYIPQLAGMVYVMNGMATQLHVQADNPGNYLGRSAHFSGDGFSGMQFITHAVPEGDFAAWISKVQQDGPALDVPGYRELSRQSQNVSPFTYRAAEPGLFEAVVRQQIPPGPGPEQGRGSPDTHPQARR
jgi:cytochrome o ubiquinol oxidase subunit 2